MTEDGWRIGGRYLVLGRLGSGGMAEVFRARDETLGRDVAVKVFRSDVSSSDTAARVERRETELNALARLNHPNLITLYDAELSAHPAYLVMELVEGASLAERIANGPLAEPACRELGRQIAAALAFVHAQGMVHRDVKPANILLGTDGRARLSDFGIVRLLGAESLTNADSTLGTASYLAPEQMHGSQVGPPADVYALGLTLIEALTGTRSFDGPPLEAAMARLARDPEIPEYVADPWPRLLAAMTARDPSARPSAEQVALALRTDAGALAGLPAQAPAGAATVALSTVVARSTTSAASAASVPTVSPPPRRGLSGGVLTAIAAVVVLLVAGLVALLVTSSSDDSPSTGNTTSVTRSNSASTSSSRSAPSSASTTTSRSAAPSASAPSTPETSSSTSSSPSSPSSPSAPPSVSTSAGSSPAGASGSAGNAQVGPPSASP